MSSCKLIDITEFTDESDKQTKILFKHPTIDNSLILLPKNKEGDLFTFSYKRSNSEDLIILKESTIEKLIEKIFEKINDNDIDENSIVIQDNSNNIQSFSTLSILLQSRVMTAETQISLFEEKKLPYSVRKEITSKTPPNHKFFFGYT